MNDKNERRKIKNILITPRTIHKKKSTQNNQPIIDNRI